jgi:hypothetical protein
MMDGTSLGGCIKWIMRSVQGPDQGHRHHESNKSFLPNLYCGGLEDSEKENRNQETLLTRTLFDTNPHSENSNVSISLPATKEIFLLRLKKERQRKCNKSEKGTSGGWGGKEGPEF